MVQLPDETDMAGQIELLIYEPEYWENLAQAKRAQAACLGAQVVFATTLLRHAEDFDRLARQAFKLRQQRRTLLGVEPRHRGAASTADLTVLKGGATG